MHKCLNFFATCPKGVEDLLELELRNLGAEQTKMTVGGVYFGANINAAYKMCLWSRLANRILWLLNSLENSPPISSDLALYSAAIEVPWEQFIDPSKRICVDFSGTNKAINNSQFGAMRVKDAIVDRMRNKVGERPQVDRHNPEIRINARLIKGQVQLALDLAGSSLH